MNTHTCLADEITELIHGRNGMPPYLLGPASEKQVAYAERELRVTFPPSFRTFLKHFGGGFVFDHAILGLVGEPGHWLDIVQMNRRPPRHIPQHYVLFFYAGGDLAYYLDTSRPDASGECPVVVFGLGEEGVRMADSFLDFLRQAKDGLA